MERRHISKTVKGAIIGGICTIIAAVIGVFNFDLSNVIIPNEWKEKYEILQNDYNKLNEDYNELQNSYNSLLKEIESLQNKQDTETSNDSLNNDITSLTKQIDSLKNENEALINENERLKSEIEASKKTIPDPEADQLLDEHNKTNISDLILVNGYNDWIEYSDSDSYKFVDVYGNKYSGGYIGEHQTSNHFENYGKPPIYSLNCEYSKCKGQIAWAKSERNGDEEIWIEFYADDTLIFSSDKLNSLSKALSFEFSVKDVDNLKILKKTSSGYVIAIYPYLYFE